MKNSGVRNHTYEDSVVDCRYHRDFLTTSSYAAIIFMAASDGYGGLF